MNIISKKTFGTFLAAVSAAGLLAGCAGSSDSVDSADENAVFKPGEYTGQSSEDDDEEGGGYGIVTIKIGENNAIEDVKFETFEKNGTSKHSEDYGKINGQASNQSYYEKAQKAVAAAEGYAQQYLQTGDLDSVDAVSGATISYNQFREAVNIALKEAAKVALEEAAQAQ